MMNGLQPEEKFSGGERFARINHKYGWIGFIVHELAIGLPDERYNADE